MVDSIDYNKWLDRANQDIRVVDIIRQQGMEGLEDSFCYNCQQAAEKFLKAFLIRNEKSIPKTHDLVFLLSKCTRYEPLLKDLEDAVVTLNEYSISARYPNDFDDKRTVEEAEEAYSFVKKVKENIEKYIF